jgi:mRNA-degrading endonuclease RelE of RelBE toxin-antitoxin system
MNYRLSTISCFDVAAKRLAKKYPSFKKDLADFCKALLENPNQGAELYPGIRKMRLAIKSKGKGKSGGARVITYEFITKELDGEIVLLLIYDKENTSTVDVCVLKEIISEAGLPIG